MVEGCSVLCDFSTFPLNNPDSDLANPHLAIIRRDLYMYIFAWLHKKSRASYKHWKRAAPPTRYHFFLSAGKNHLELSGNCFFCRVRGSPHSQWGFRFQHQNISGIIASTRGLRSFCMSLSLQLQIPSWASVPPQPRLNEKSASL